MMTFRGSPFIAVFVFVRYMEEVSFEYQIAGICCLVSEELQITSKKLISSFVHS